MYMVVLLLQYSILHLFVWRSRYIIVYLREKRFGCSEVCPSEILAIYNQTQLFRATFKNEETEPKPFSHLFVHILPYYTVGTFSSLSFKS